MLQLKYILLASSILLILNFSTAIPLGKKHWSEYNGEVIIDRSNSSTESKGFYMSVHDVDRTTFALNQDVWLERIDLTKIYGYNLVNAIPLEQNAIAEVNLVETKDTGYTDTIFSVNTTVNSLNEVEIYLYPAIALNRTSMYEIEVKVPDIVTVYEENLEIKEYFVETKLDTEIGVKCFQRNPPTLPQSNFDMLRKLSQGVVKRLHLKY